MQLWRLRWHWNKLGYRDPLANILTRAADEAVAWDVNEFFETGRPEVSKVMAGVERLAPSLPKRRALDFGCGVGRITQGLANHFDETIGVDIASSMIEAARKWNRISTRCRFVVNQGADLTQFASDGFDFVYSRLVLQHVPPRLVRRYVPELVRVLHPDGLLVFQLSVPEDRGHHVDPIDAFCGAPVVGGRFKRSLPHWVVRAYRRVKYPLLPVVIRRFGSHVYRRIHGVLVPHMDMFGMEREAVVELVESSGGRVVDVRPDASDANVAGFEYWVKKCSSSPGPGPLGLE